MKKLIIFIGLLALTVNAHAACDGNCACGGKPVPTKLEQISSALYTVGEYGLYIGAGLYLSAKGIAAWPIGIPGLCVYLSSEQRAYNRANGISHSREKRDGWRSRR